MDLSRIGRHQNGKLVGDFETIEEWFEAKTMPEPNSGCWIWLGAVFYRHDRPYMPRPKVTVRSKSIIGNRLAYRIYKGEIPDGLLVCHTCDTPLCVNPDHLWLGTHKDNSTDMVRKGRASKCPPVRVAGDRQGEANPNSRLTEAQVRKIRADARPYAAVSADYGVAVRTIRDIQAGRSWQHLAA